MSRILKAAQTLFTDRGYDATTMADVSRRAGVSAGLTVYYFRTKQHLVQALADRLLHAEMVRAARSRPVGSDEQVAAVIDAALQTAAQHQLIIGMHLALLLQPGAEQLLADGEHHFEEQLTQALVGMLGGRGDAVDAAEAWMFFRARLMGAVYGIVSPYLPMPYEVTRRRLFADYGLDWNLGSPPATA